ncbi:hypothetical protein VT03_07025 [Planctomyces sp. SH-PL14]|nr:hypothetical protein VT03_07025 [Planctomyces sp. SH-PL14]
MWQVKDQIVSDPATGLTIQLETMPGTDAPYRLRLFGDLPFGNREILFDAAGNEAGSGTLLTGLCKPTWSIPVSDQA